MDRPCRRFTGEHVGEPRLIVTLVGPPLLHVDFMFVRARDFGERREDPEVLWDRDGRLARSLAEHPLRATSPDLQWIEDRFWIWVHYGATKLGRGELFETVGFLGYLRDTVLGPMPALRVGAPPRGVRHLESVAPAEARALRATLCGHDRQDAMGHLHYVIVGTVTPGVIAGPSPRTDPRKREAGAYAAWCSRTPPVVSRRPVRPCVRRSAADTSGSCPSGSAPGCRSRPG
ncbi:hypothetical protein ACFWBV_35110 [Streptomyces sp. NPDC060030]|uniref:hypothetical protein n=1 Tax=Streptomyces sp. NPDC060030 TaxID=3347042 RepID=UPI00367A1956